jgi:hypothetical protein
MRAFLACFALYVVALCVWAWSIHAPEPGPAYRIIDIRFCPDWRDGQYSRCDTIPLRKEVEI